MLFELGRPREALAANGAPTYPSIDQIHAVARACGLTPEEVYEVRALASPQQDSVSDLLFDTGLSLGNVEIALAVATRCRLADHVRKRIHDLAATNDALTLTLHRWLVDDGIEHFRRERARLEFTGGDRDVISRIKWSYQRACEIAARTGEGERLRTQVEELARTAPLPIAEALGIEPVRERPAVSPKDDLLTQLIMGEITRDEYETAVARLEG